MVPRSISVTRAPCSTAFSAAAIAAPPLPMTAICNAPLLPVLSFLPSRSRILSSNPPGVETEGHRPAWPDNRVQLQRPSARRVTCRPQWRAWRCPWRRRHPLIARRALSPGVLDMHCARVASHAGDFESAHTIVPYSCGPPCRTVSRLSQALGGEFAAVRSATAMRRRHEVPDRHPNHQGQADVHQVRRPPVAEQPDRGRKHDGRADHAEQTAQPLLMTEPTQRVRQEGQRGKQRQQAADEQSLVLAQEAQPDGRAEAGEGWKAKAAQPIAETTLPSAPVLSAMRVISPMKRLAVVVGLLAHCLTLDG